MYASVGITPPGAGKGVHGAVGQPCARLTGLTAADVGRLCARCWRGRGRGGGGGGGRLCARVELRLRFHVATCHNTRCSIQHHIVLGATTAPVLACGEELMGCREEINTGPDCMTGRSWPSLHALSAKQPARVRPALIVLLQLATKHLLTSCIHAHVHSAGCATKVASPDPLTPSNLQNPIAPRPREAMHNATCAFVLMLPRPPLLLGQLLHAGVQLLQLLLLHQAQAAHSAAPPAGRSHSEHAVS